MEPNNININIGNESIQKLPEIKKNHYLAYSIFLFTILSVHLFIGYTYFSYISAITGGIVGYITSALVISIVLTVIFALVSIMIRKISKKYGKNLGLFLWFILAMGVFLGVFGYINSFNNGAFKEGEAITLSEEGGKYVVRPLMSIGQPIKNSKVKTVNELSVYEDPIEGYSFQYPSKNSYINDTRPPLKYITMVLPLNSATSSANVTTEISLEAGSLETCEEKNIAPAKGLRTREKIGELEILKEEGVTYSQEVVYYYMYMFKIKNKCFFINQYVGHSKKDLERIVKEYGQYNPKNIIDRLDVSEAQSIMTDVISSIKVLSAGEKFKPSENTERISGVYMQAAIRDDMIRVGSISKALSEALSDWHKKYGNNTNNSPYTGMCKDLSIQSSKSSYPVMTCRESFDAFVIYYKMKNKYGYACVDSVSFGVVDVQPTGLYCGGTVSAAPTPVVKKGNPADTKYVQVDIPNIKPFTDCGIQGYKDDVEQQEGIRSSSCFNRAISFCQPAIISGVVDPLINTHRVIGQEGGQCMLAQHFFNKVSKKELEGGFVKCVIDPSKGWSSVASCQWAE